MSYVLNLTLNNYFAFLNLLEVERVLHTKHEQINIVFISFPGIQRNILVHFVVSISRPFNRGFR